MPTRPALLNIELETGNTTIVAEDNHYDIERVLTHPRTRTLEAVRFIRARAEWLLLDHSLDADFEALRMVRDGDFGGTINTHRAAGTLLGFSPIDF
jgi:hypothetical protein